MRIRPLLLIFIFAGFALSAIVLIPAHDFINYHEQMRGLVIETNNYSSAFDYTLHQFLQTFLGRRFEGILFFGFIGAVVGIIFYLIFKSVYNSRDLVKSLSAEISRDIESIMAKGESRWLEFKSSFRWDYQKNTINRNLEEATLKTIAAFMNADGGSLLIGVADDGSPLGLEPDYSTLKRKDRDGFEVALMTAISAKMGTQQCSRVTILFHIIEGDDICHLIVAKSPKPVFVTSGKEPLFYLRTGAGTRKLNVRETTEYIAEHW